MSSVLSNTQFFIYRSMCSTFGVPAHPVASSTIDRETSSSLILFHLSPNPKRIPRPSRPPLSLPPFFVPESMKTVGVGAPPPLLPPPLPPVVVGGVRRRRSSFLLESMEKNKERGRGRRAGCWLWQGRKWISSYLRCTRTDFFGAKEKIFPRCPEVNDCDGFLQRQWRWGVPVPLRLLLGLGRRRPQQHGHHFDGRPPLQPRLRGPPRAGHSARLPLRAGAGRVPDLHVRGRRGRALPDGAVRAAAELPLAQGGRPVLPVDLPGRGRGQARRRRGPSRRRRRRGGGRCQAEAGSQLPHSRALHRTALLPHIQVKRSFSRDKAARDVVFTDAAALTIKTTEAGAGAATTITAVVVAAIATTITTVVVVAAAAIATT